jgi:hypothetical protein
VREVKAEGRRQKAEGRRQKAEGRRQKAEGRRQKALTFAAFGKNETELSFRAKRGISLCVREVPEERSGQDSSLRSE